VITETSDCLDRDAGRTLHDYYSKMTYQGLDNELPIALICPTDEDSEDEDDLMSVGRSEASGSRCDGEYSNHRAGDGDIDARDGDLDIDASSRSQDKDGGQCADAAGSAILGGGPKPCQLPARGHNGGRGAGVDVDTPAEQDEDRQSQLSTPRDFSTFFPKYDDTGGPTSLCYAIDSTMEQSTCHADLSGAVYTRVCLSGWLSRCAGRPTVRKW
jgi:hypothetical protein